MELFFQLIRATEASWEVLDLDFPSFLRGSFTSAFCWLQPALFGSFFVQGTNVEVTIDFAIVISVKCRHLISSVGPPRLQLPLRLHGRTSWSNHLLPSSTFSAQLAFTGKSALLFSLSHDL